MEAISPVLPGRHDVIEIQLAKDQPEYTTLPTAVMKDEAGTLISRWSLSHHERKIIADGGEIVLQQLTFFNPFQPVNIQVVASGELPKFVE